MKSFIEYYKQTKRTITEAEMLDISITALDKAVKKIPSLLSQNVVITEKTDGCLEYSTEIVTKEYGVLPIGKIVDERIQCSVLSFNHETNLHEFREVTQVLNSGRSDNWVEILLEDGTTLTITDNHWVWSETDNTYKQEKDLVVGEEMKKNVQNSN